MIPGQGAKIPHASGPKNQNIKQKQYCNKFNKDFKNGPHQKVLKKKKIAPKCKSRDAGNLDMLKRSCKVLPLSEKVKVLNSVRKEKKGMLRLLRSTVRIFYP